jgi:hypothetical protein
VLIKEVIMYTLLEITYLQLKYKVNSFVYFIFEVNQIIKLHLSYKFMQLLKNTYLLM